MEAKWENSEGSSAEKGCRAQPGASRRVSEVRAWEHGLKFSMTRGGLEARIDKGRGIEMAEAWRSPGQVWARAQRGLGRGGSQEPTGTAVLAGPQSSPG